MVKIALLSISWFLGNQEEIKTSSPQEAYGKQAYGKQSYGKQGNGKQGKNPPEEEEEEEEDEDVVYSTLPYYYPIYLIAPSGGVVPPGELVPLSPSNPVFKGN